AIMLLLAGGTIGAILIWTGTYKPYRWALHWHIAIAAVGSLLLFIGILPRVRPVSRQRAVLFLLLFSLLLPAVVQSYQRYRIRSEEQIVNPSAPPLTMNDEGAGANGPFFPSSAETTSHKKIPSNFFMTSQTCKRCHPDIYNQWFSSAHHFSSFNNQWYRKSIEYMQDTIGTKPSKWCGGCHDHAVLFNGMMDTPIRKILNTPEAQAGLACTSCHSIVHVKSTMGQGDFTIEYPAMHDLAVSDNKLATWAHDYLIRTDPEPHRRTFLKSFHKSQTPEFCSSCQKVQL